MEMTQLQLWKSCVEDVFSATTIWMVNNEQPLYRISINASGACVYNHWLNLLIRSCSQSRGTSSTEKLLSKTHFQEPNFLSYLHSANKYWQIQLIQHVESWMSDMLSLQSMYESRNGPQVSAWKSIKCLFCWLEEYDSKLFKEQLLLLHCILNQRHFQIALAKCNSSALPPVCLHSCCS